MRRTTGTLGALSRRLRAPFARLKRPSRARRRDRHRDDNRAEARARRRHRSWWWDDADAAADSEVEEIGLPPKTTRTTALLPSRPRTTKAAKKLLRYCLYAPDDESITQHLLLLRIT